MSKNPITFHAPAPAPKLPPTSQHPTLRIVVISALVSTVITVVINRACDKFFPSVQLVALISSPKELQLGSSVSQTRGDDPYPSRHAKIRPGMPPYIYSITYLKHVEEHPTGFLNLDRTVPFWIYRLSVGNLTVDPLKTVDLTVQYDGPMNLLGLYSNNAMFSNPDDPAPIDEISVRPPTKKLSATIKPVNVAWMVLIGISSKTRPDLADIHVHARSSEGEFVQITEAEWESVWYPNK